MIYFIHGDDTEKSIKKSLELVEILRKKKPHSLFFKMDAEHFDISVLEEYISSQGLFEDKYIVFLDRIFEDKEHKDILLKKVKDIAKSKNIFIILEGKIDKISKEKIEKNAEKSQVFILKEIDKKEVFNIFSLADFLAKKDKKSLWIFYRKAIDRGDAPEAIEGIFFWKVKTMISTGYNGPYKKSELLNIAYNLIILCHDTRRGINDIETGLESIILSL